VHKSKQELLELILDMDFDLCAILDDPEGQSEAIDKLRDYEKCLMAVLELEDVFEKALGFELKNADRRLAEWRLYRASRQGPYQPKGPFSGN